MHELAYLAAMIDGEGSIALHRHTQHNRQTFAMRPRLVVSNCHLGMLEILKYRHGGSIILADRATDKRRAAYLWRVCGRLQISSLLSSIRPYLIIKSQHADLLLRFLELRSTAKIGSSAFAPYGAEEDGIFEKLRELNRRGVTCD